MTITATTPTALAASDTATVAWKTDTAGTYVVAVGNLTVARGEVGAGASESTAIAGTALSPGLNIITVLVAPSLRRAGKATTELTLSDGATSGGAPSGSGSSSGESSSGSSSGSSAGSSSGSSAGSTGGPVLTLFAGALGGDGTADDKGADARFTQLADGVVDANGVVYVADYGDYTVRRITADGTVTTIIGKAGSSGCFSGFSAVLGTSGRLSQPTGLVLNGTTLYVSEAGCSRTLIKIDTVTLMATALNITASTIKSPQGLAITPDGSSLFVADTGANANIYKVALASGPPYTATTLVSSNGSSTNGGADCASATLKKAQKLAWDNDGLRLFLSEPQADIIEVLGPFDGTPADCHLTTVASGSTEDNTPPSDGPLALTTPDALFYDALGHHLYVGDWGLNEILVFDASASFPLAASLTTYGVRYDYDFRDRLASQTNFDVPVGLALAGTKLTVIDAGNSQTVRIVDVGGTVNTVTLAGLHLGGMLPQVTTPDGGASALPAATRFLNPTDVDVDVADNVYVCGRSSDPSIKVYSPVSGRFTRLISSGQQPCQVFGVSADGKTLFAGSGEEYPATGNGLYRYAKAANGSWSLVSAIKGAVVHDGSGDHDQGYAESATLSTVASFYSIEGVAVDTDGSVYVSDTENEVIRHVTYNADGTLATTALLAGTPGTAGFTNTIDGTVLFSAPAGLALSGRSLFIADKGNHCIRRMDLLTGTVTTFAGGQAGPGLLDGPIDTAMFLYPQQLRFNGAGDLYVSDTQSASVRRIAAALTATSPMVDTPVGSLEHQWGVKAGPLPARVNVVPGFAFSSDGTMWLISEEGLLTAK